jgi:hypothetical protein
MRCTVILLYHIRVIDIDGFMKGTGRKIYNMKYLSFYKIHLNCGSPIPGHVKIK